MAINSGLAWRGSCVCHVGRFPGRCKMPPSEAAKAKGYGTRGSQAVSHPSTGRAQPSFTSVIGREPVDSRCYGRSRKKTAAKPPFILWPYYYKLKSTQIAPLSRVFVQSVLVPRDGGGGRHWLYCNARTTHGRVEASFEHPPPFKNPINTCTPNRSNPGVNLDRTDTTLWS